MIAAYAIALQALLGAVLVAETAAAKPANADSFVICLDAEHGIPPDHGTHAPQHDHCVLCTGIAHSAPAWHAAAAHGTPATDGATVIWHRPDWRAPAPPTTLAARPRGPPLTA